MLLNFNCSVAFDKGGHDTTANGLDTEGKRGNFEKDQVLGLLGGVSRKNGGLDSGTIGNGLVRVDALVGLLAIKVGHELDDRENTNEATNEDDFVHIPLVDLGVVEDFLKGCCGRDLGKAPQREYDTLVQRVDLSGGLGGRRGGMLSTLASSAETTDANNPFVSP